MATRRVIVELRYNPGLADTAFAGGPGGRLDPESVPRLDGVTFDERFPPTALPGREPGTRAESSYVSCPVDRLVEPERSTYIVRAEVDERMIDALRADENVVGVFSDPPIEPIQASCPGWHVGSYHDVERLLCASGMRSIGMDGLGVLVAIVDTGINMAHLKARGKTPSLDAARSWAPEAGLPTPGDSPVDHGTMCAYDACIIAPKCTLLDIALLACSARSLTTLLSDAVRAFRHLFDVMVPPVHRWASHSMVVNNSWGMFKPSFDFPPGGPGNYSDNPNHPFNRIVGDLEWAGADILFAAGNCGPECPDSRCEVTSNTIYGANGHPSVLCVAGVDTSQTRLGYSSVGPGRLTRAKPDVSGYTHFRGSGVYPSDGGTSAATPVVAGVVAAVRSKRPYRPGNPATHPAAIRALITSTAEDLGPAGFDFEHGFGVVNGCALLRRFAPLHFFTFCERYPALCVGGTPTREALRPVRLDAQMGGGAMRPADPPPRMLGVEEAPGEFWSSEAGTAGPDEDLRPLPTASELAYLSGYLDASRGRDEGPRPRPGGRGGCSCGGNPGA
ncbi:S8 family serine peptidase [Tautonia plasticadhaerens]|uniref:Subtilisin DY n=1 Tax=Tautonia plasticadhaerens TaxID=2527974 RepID=A0A518H013_9BACT|nr:S8 family serine peptidase [Tautonia plasticadhaerens]QDV34175.1 Subtilisin DY [Tautonia plasticadhaerens]